MAYIFESLIEILIYWYNSYCFFAIHKVCLKRQTGTYLLFTTALAIKREIG